MKIRIIAAAIAVAAIEIASALRPEAAVAATDEAPLPVQEFLAGYDSGLYRIDEGGARALPLWLEGEVRKILSTPEGWYFLTSKGVIYSRDLADFEDRSHGLPVKTYKRYEEGRKSFQTEIQDLKDLEVAAFDPKLMATCTKDGAFVSRDGALSWEGIGSPNTTTGLKAVALAPAPGSADMAIWASHPIKGLYYRKLSPSNSIWKEANAGFAISPGTTSAEEVADIVPAIGGGLWASNSFLSRLYRMEASSASFSVAWKTPGDFGCVESLSPLQGGDLRFVSDVGISRFSAATGQAVRDEPATAVLDAALRAKPEWQLLSLSWAEEGGRAGLSELWLASFIDRKPFRKSAENRNGLYLSTGFVVNEDARTRYGEVMERTRLDSVVIDMKDDFGKLRFEPKDPLLRKVGKVVGPLDIEGFAQEWKAKGRYLIARIPVFKDEVAYRYGGGAWACWDSGKSTPWQGYNVVKKYPPAPKAPVTQTPPSILLPTPGAALNLPAPGPAPASTAPVASPAPPTASPAPTTERVPIQEYWVDPYCEEIWAYNVAIANEMIARGFDEVQFDYIRFPTDGSNLDSLSYRWRDPGMDKESALASFLRYARENIAAPISIDIYGANGWFRTGARTGQDVELLAKYVDVICPMLYPSHFEQDFLAQNPAEQRPYRIYRIGTLRNAYIARKKVIVRPYVQAFYLNVSYDRIHYGLDYVKREVEGIRDSVNSGMTFWNNGGRYDDIPVLDLAPDGKLATGKVPPAASRTAERAAAQSGAQAAGAQARAEASAPGPSVLD